MSFRASVARGAREEDKKDERKKNIVYRQVVYIDASHFINHVHSLTQTQTSQINKEQVSEIACFEYKIIYDIMFEKVVAEKLNLKSSSFKLVYDELKLDFEWKETQNR